MRFSYLLALLDVFSVCTSCPGGGGGGGGGAHSYSVHLFVIAHVCAPLTRPRSHIIIQCDYGLYAQDIARYCFTRELAAVPVCGIHVI